MTLVCEEMFQDTSMPASILIALYRGFIEKWHKKMNQLSFAKFSVRIAEILGKQKQPFIRQFVIL
jgi:hypothetical protein